MKNLETKKQTYSESHYNFATIRIKMFGVIKLPLKFKNLWTNDGNVLFIDISRQENSIVSLLNFLL